MCVIHTLPTLLGEAEDLQTTKVNAKDKANQTPLSVCLIHWPFTTNDLMLNTTWKASRRYHRFNGDDLRASENSTGIAKDSAQHG
jgi:hypothetical protein